MMQRALFHVHRALHATQRQLIVMRRAMSVMPRAMNVVHHSLIHAERVWSDARCALRDVYDIVRGMRCAFFNRHCPLIRV